MNKRSVTLFLSLMILWNILSSIPVISADDLLYSESFESNFSDLPSGWSYFSSGTGTSSYQEVSEASQGYKSIGISDQSTSSSIGVQTPAILISPGTEYTVFGDVYNLSGSGSIILRFFTSSDRVLASKTAATSVQNKWMPVFSSLVAPADASYAKIILYSAINSTCIVNYDNIKLYSTVGLSEDVANPPVQNTETISRLIAPIDGKLSYFSYNEKGDRLSDYSFAGFYAGAYELPETARLPQFALLLPSSDPNADDTERIQNAINICASSLSPEEMAVVKLSPGKYYINKAGLTLKSGVVLSGSGQGPNGTVLYAKDTSQYSVVKTTGSAPSKESENIYLTDSYVSAGSKTLHLSRKDVVNFSPGDVIAIYHPCTNDWVNAMGMNNITNVYGNTTSWSTGSVDFKMERTITAVSDNSIELDFPLFVPLDQAYAKTYIYKIKDIGRTENFGLENLRLESCYNGSPTDEEHADIAVEIAYAKNGFVRDISAKYFVLSAVRCLNYTKQITVQHCSSLEPISQIAGGRRYSFSCSSNTQQILFTGCYSYGGRHDYMASYSGTGPIAFVDNTADHSNAASETHGNWTTGLLYDNVYQISGGTKGFFAFANRGVYGTALSQGWTAGGCLAWNSLAPVLIAHKPPLTYQNFLIGAWGIYDDESSKLMKTSNINSYKDIYRTSYQTTGSNANFETVSNTSFSGDAYMESPTAPVNPRSIMKAQLAERITGNYENARPNAPILISPPPEKQVSSQSFYVTGIFQKGAQAVTIYVDDQPYLATLNSQTNTFFCHLNLEEGWHKIYGTQTVSGIESTKDADRFILAGTADISNSPDLSSSYSVQTTRLILKDPRLTYDQYLLQNQPVTRKIIEGEVSNHGIFLFSPAFNPCEVIQTQNGPYTMDRKITYQVAMATIQGFNGWTITDYGISIDGVNYSGAPYIKDNKYGILFYGNKISEGNSFLAKLYVNYQNDDTKESFTAFGSPHTFMVPYATLNSWIYDSGFEESGVTTYSISP